MSGSERSRAPLDDRDGRELADIDLTDSDDRYAGADIHVRMIIWQISTLREV